MRTRRLLCSVIAAILLCSLAVAPAFAVESRSGDSVVVGPDQTIDDDLFSTANTTTVLGHVRGDVIAFGSELDVSGEVDGDVLVAASTVVITGTVHGNVRGVAQTLTVKGKVERNLSAFAGTTNLSKGSVVGVDALLAGGQSDVEGNVGRGLTASVSALTLGGAVGRDADVTGQTILLEPTARIAGTFRYVSSQIVTVPAGTVAGSIQRIDPVDARSQQTASDASAVTNLLSVLWLLGDVILGLLLVHFLPGIAAVGRQALVAHPLPSFATGVVVLVGVPIASFVAALTVIGLPIGLVGGAVWIVAVLAGWILAAVALANVVVGRVQQGAPSAPQEVLVTAGLLVLFFLTRVPIIGGAVSFIILCLGVGALAQGVRAAWPRAAASP